MSMAGMRDIIGVRIEVPIASFRVPQAREYFETYTVPPPATVFGMLLSYVGEPWRLRHANTQLALAVTAQPSKSTVLRTMHQFKKPQHGQRGNQRPDFQELVTQLEIAAWIAAGASEGINSGTYGDLRASIPLTERVRRTIENPASSERFGGLCLGESTGLVNSIDLLPTGEHVHGTFLVPSPTGHLTLPVWPDHVGGASTRWGRYDLEEMAVHTPDADMFTVMAPL